MLTGGDPVLVTAAEKEQIGYEVPAGVQRPSRQRLVLAHRAEIDAVVQPLVEDQLGRQVELGTINATVPWSEVSLTYRTVDEPVLAGTAYVGIASDGSATGIERIDENTVARLTVEGLYLMAYRERITQMREYLAATYPQFTAPPAGYLDAIASADPMFRVTDYYQYGEQRNVEEIYADTDTIYQEYLADPDRTDAEWAALLDAVLEGREMELTVDLMLADPQAELTEDLSRQVADDVRTNPVFTGFGSWFVNTRSNLIARDGTGFYDFHQMFLFDADTERPDEVWSVDYWEDGGTIWGKLDGGETWTMSGASGGSTS
ncbi:MAG TPA: hypothetical protein VGC67_02740 [Cellulomonas sp.]